MCYHTKLTLFTVSKDEWDTKEDTGKSMNNVLYVLRYAKRHLSSRCQKAPLRLKRRRIVKKTNKPVALAIIELRLSKGMSQLFTQSVENSVN